MSNPPGAFRGDKNPMARGGNSQVFGRLTAQSVECNSVDANAFGVRGDATQVTNITASVATRGRQGVITCKASTLAADTATSFVLANQFITPTSVVLLTLSYAAGLDGSPVLYTSNQGAKVVTIILKNVHAADALNAADGDIKIHYLIMG